jgi:hypothetical protein
MGCVQSTVKEDANRAQEALKCPVAGVSAVNDPVKACGAQQVRPEMATLCLSFTTRLLFRNVWCLTCECR